MKLVAISAPFAACNDLTIADNVQRALRLYVHALEQGHAPISLHAAPFYGALDDTVPDLRERGLRCCERICQGVARDGGELWALKRPDGTLSSGCQREISAFLGVANVVRSVRYFEDVP
jgi:hypothetical protein